MYIKTEKVTDKIKFVQRASFEQGALLDLKQKLSILRLFSAPAKNMINRTLITFQGPTFWLKNMYVFDYMVMVLFGKLGHHKISAHTCFFLIHQIECDQWKRDEYYFTPETEDDIIVIIPIKDINADIRVFMLTVAI